MYNEKDIIAQWNADMYDLNETYTNDVEFALMLMGTTPKKVLEIACGSGRFLVPVAKAGHDVTGLDFDEYMLEKITHKIANEKIKWHKADVIYDDWGTGFDVVTLGANFLFNIVSDMNYEQAQKLMFQKSADALAVGGHIFVDYAYPQYPEKCFHDPNPNIVWEGTDSHGNYGKMAVIDNISVEDLKTYQKTLVSIGNFDKSCGFICGKADLEHWNPLEICHLLNTTKDYYGELKNLVPAYTIEDERNYVRLSLNNLYHEICHRYIHADREYNISKLPITCKSIFFIMQHLYYLSSGNFISTKRELLACVQDEDKAVLELSVSLQNHSDYDFDKAFSILFSWCQNALLRII